MADQVAKRQRTRDTENQKAARLGRQDWINAAIVKLAEDNVEALRVDELAERLEVTKGSFYWHFDSREALLAAVLESWQQMMTSETRALVDQPSDAPWDRLDRLLRIAISARPDVPGGPFELTLRDWARRDPRVAKVVGEVDEARARFVADLYQSAGLDRDTAQDYADAQMAYVIGGRMTLAQETPEKIVRRRRIAKELFLPRHLTKADKAERS